MRPLVKTLAVIGLASAIAEKAKHMTDDATAKAAYEKLEAETISAMRAFPGMLHPKEVKLTHRNISKFCDVMGWDRKNMHIQTLMNFSSTQLEHIRAELVAHNAVRSRVSVIEKLIDMEADIYDRYSKRESALCAVAGQRASEAWDSIWSR